MGFRNVENKLKVSRWKGGGISEETEIHTLLHIKQITSEDYCIAQGTLPSALE